MKIVVAGSRSIEDYTTVKDCIETALDENEWEMDTLISGNSEGVDYMAEKWASGQGITINRFPVTDELIQEYGQRRAPMHRNYLMMDEADALIAVWDGESNGTQGIINMAKNMDKPFRVFVP